MLLSAGLVVAVAARMLTEDTSVFLTNHVWLLMVMCVFAIGLFGAFALFRLRDLMRVDPILIVETDGITDKRLGPDMIPWSVVRGVKLLRVNRRPVLEIAVDVPPGELLRVSGFRRYFQKLSAGTNQQNILISLTGLRARPETVLQTMRTSFESRPREANISLVTQAAE